MAEHGVRKIAVGWVVAACAVVSAGLALTALHGAAVVEQLWFVDDAVVLEAPGSYRVQAARASTWTLLQEAPASGASTPVTVRVRAPASDVDVAARVSAADYRYARAGKQGFSAFDFTVPAAGEYEVQLSAGTAVTMRLVDDVRGRLLEARRGMLRAGALAAGSLALALALLGVGFLVTRPRRVRAMAPGPAPLAAARRPATAVHTPRGLKVLPALPTSVTLQRYGLAPPKQAAARSKRPRLDTSRVPSVA